MSAITLKPLNDHIIVEPTEEEQPTVSRPVSPDTTAERLQVGKVVAVTGRRHDATTHRFGMGVSVGDVVIFQRHSSKEFQKQPDLDDLSFCPQCKSYLEVVALSPPRLDWLFDKVEALPKLRT